MDGDRHRQPRPLPTMMIALIIMFNTFRPILTPTVLNGPCQEQEMITEAEFRVRQVAINCFWMFSNSAFAFALVAALVQVWSCVAHGSVDVADPDRKRRSERVSFRLVMVALVCVSLVTKCVLVVRLCPSWFLSASSLIEGLFLLLTLSASYGVLKADIVG